MKKENFTINDHVQNTPLSRGFLGRIGARYVLPVLTTLGLASLVHASDIATDYDGGIDALATNAVAGVVSGTNDVVTTTNGYDSATNDYQNATNEVEKASSTTRVVSSSRAASSSKPASRVYTTSAASEPTYSGEKSATEENKPIATAPMAPMNDNTKTTSDANAPVTANASTNSIVEPRICRIDLVGSNIDIAATNLVTDAYYMLQESGNMLPTTPGGSNIWENIQNTFVKYTGTDGGVTNWLVTPKGDVGFYRVRGVKE